MPFILHCEDSSPVIPTDDFAPDALLLAAHGTRDAVGLAQTHELGRLIASRVPSLPVELGFLELAEPTIAEAVARLVSGGARRVTVAPLLLFAAGHARDDIPAQLERCRHEHRELEFRLAGALGCHPKVVELSELRCREALQALGADVEAQSGPVRTPRMVGGAHPTAAQSGPVGTRRTVGGAHPTTQSGPVATGLLLVGRGSSDERATAEMARFAGLRCARQPETPVEIGFVAKARPTLREALETVSALPWQQVVVQPHLLFAGEVLETIRQEARRSAEKQSSARGQETVCRTWLVAEPLGPHELLAEALLSVCGLSGAPTALSQPGNGDIALRDSPP
jgi:sirohydrochlorin cobaltochelatase